MRGGAAAHERAVGCGATRNQVYVTVRDSRVPNHPTAGAGKKTADSLVNFSSVQHYCSLFRVTLMITPDFKTEEQLDTRIIRNH
jgi:hypothetical protein